MSAKKERLLSQIQNTIGQDMELNMIIPWIGDWSRQDLTTEQMKTISEAMIQHLDQMVDVFYDLEESILEQKMDSSYAGLYEKTMQLARDFNHFRARLLCRRYMHEIENQFHEKLA